jgi:hypothetical protein
MAIPLLSRFSSTLFLGASIFMAGCAAPNPVREWKPVAELPDVPSQRNKRPPGYNTSTYLPGQLYHVDQAILDDYPNFIEELKRKYPIVYLDYVHFYEDGTGQHAVKISVLTGSRQYTEFYLMYDKANVRSKVIKGRTWVQFHI